jgi:hypothetical protein
MIKQQAADIFDEVPSISIPMETEMETEIGTNIVNYIEKYTSPSSQIARELNHVIDNIIETPIPSPKTEKGKSKKEQEKLMNEIEQKLSALQIDKKNKSGILEKTQELPLYIQHEIDQAINEYILQQQKEEKKEKRQKRKSEEPKMDEGELIKKMKKIKVGPKRVKVIHSKEVMFLQQNHPLKGRKGTIVRMRSGAVPTFTIKIEGKENLIERVYESDIFYMDVLLNSGKWFQVNTILPNNKIVGLEFSNGRRELIEIDVEQIAKKNAGFQMTLPTIQETVEPEEETDSDEELRYEQEYIQEQEDTVEYLPEEQGEGELKVGYTDIMRSTFRKTELDESQQEIKNEIVKILNFFSNEFKIKEEEIDKSAFELDKIIKRENYKKNDTRYIIAAGVLISLIKEQQLNKEAFITRLVNEKYFNSINYGVISVFEKGEVKGINTTLYLIDPKQYKKNKVIIDKIINRFNIVIELVREMYPQYIPQPEIETYKIEGKKKEESTVIYPINYITGDFPENMTKTIWTGKEIRNIISSFINEQKEKNVSQVILDNIAQFKHFDTSLLSSDDKKQFDKLARELQEKLQPELEKIYNANMLRNYYHAVREMSNIQKSSKLLDYTKPINVSYLNETFSNAKYDKSLYNYLTGNLQENESLLLGPFLSYFTKKIENLLEVFRLYRFKIQYISLFESDIQKYSRRGALLLQEKAKEITKMMEDYENKMQEDTFESDIAKSLKQEMMSEREFENQIRNKINEQFKQVSDEDKTFMIFFFGIVSEIQNILTRNELNISKQKYKEQVKGMSSEQKMAFEQAEKEEEKKEEQRIKALNLYTLQKEKSEQRLKKMLKRAKIQRAKESKLKTIKDEEEPKGYQMIDASTGQVTFVPFPRISRRQQREDVELEEKEEREIQQQQERQRRQQQQKELFGEMEDEEFEEEQIEDSDYLIDTEDD